MVCAFKYCTQILHYYMNEANEDKLENRKSKELQNKGWKENRHLFL